MLKENFKTFYAISFAWQLGFVIAVPLAVFMFLGYLGDKFFNTSPLCLIGGVVLGIAVIVYEVYHSIIPLIKDNNNNNKTKKNNIKKR